MYRLFLLLPLFWLLSCGDAYTPKPRGYFRIALPEKEYQRYEEGVYSFFYPHYGKVEHGTSTEPNTHVMDVTFPSLNGVFHLTYHNLNGDRKLLGRLIDETYRLVYKPHSSIAEGIFPRQYENEEKQVYAVYYDLEGEVASQRQFYVTDSVNHFVRVSMYLNQVPNRDSLRPVILFLAEDAKHLVETFEWTDVASR